MPHRSLTVAALASVVLFAFAGTAGAQAHPATTVTAATKPAVAPSVAQTIAHPTLSTTGASGASSSSIMAAGPYKLGLHAQKKNNQPFNTPDFHAQTSVGRSGSGITITTADGMTLSGTVNGAQVHANGTTSDGGTLALTGTAAGTSATGTFAAHNGSNTVTGTFALASGIDMGPTTTAKIRNYGDPKPSGDGGGSTCGFWCQMKQWFGL